MEKIKRQDEFFVNGQKVRATQATVKPNDIIEYNLPVTSKVEAIQIPLNIVFEDDYFLIVDKIAGMLTHPLTFENTQTLANGVMYHFAKTNQNVAVIHFIALIEILLASSFLLKCHNYNIN